MENVAVRRETSSQVPLRAWRPLVNRSRPVLRRLLSVSLGLLAGFLLWRRLADNLTQAAPAWALVGFALLLLLAVIGDRRLAQTTRSRWVAPIASVLALFAVTLPGSSLWAACLAWSVLIAGCAVLLRDSFVPGSPLATPQVAGRRLFGWRVWLDERTRIDSPHPSTGLPESTDKSGPTAIRPACEAAVASPSSEDEADRFSRQISRGVDEDGRDLLSGWIRLSFAADQRTEVGHVEFCPPFPGAARAEAWCEDDPDAQVKIIQQMHHGMVLEMRLGERPSEGEQRMVAFQVVAVG